MISRVRRSIRESFRRKKSNSSTLTNDPDSGSTGHGSKRQSSNSTTSSQQNEKKPKNWQCDEAAVRVGTCAFAVKYLGCAEVFESRGMHVCEQALSVLRVNSATKRKPQKAILYITGEGLRVVDAKSRNLTLDQTIEKVSFCSPDRNHERGFAYICRDGTTRRWICHGFLATGETGERISHAVGCAFQICLEKKQNREKQVGPKSSIDKGETNAGVVSSPTSPPTPVAPKYTSKPGTTRVTGNQLGSNFSRSTYRTQSLAERRADPQAFKPSGNASSESSSSSSKMFFGEYNASVNYSPSKSSISPSPSLSSTPSVQSSSTTKSVNNFVRERPRASYRCAKGVSVTDSNRDMNFSPEKQIIKASSSGGNFSRNFSLRMDQLPSVLEEKRKSGLVKCVNSPKTPNSSTMEYNARSLDAFQSVPFVPEKISDICKQITFDLGNLSTVTEVKTPTSTPVSSNCTPVKAFPAHLPNSSRPTTLCSDSSAPVRHSSDDPFSPPGWNKFTSPRRSSPVSRTDLDLKLSPVNVSQVEPSLANDGPKTNGLFFPVQFDSPQSNKRSHYTSLSYGAVGDIKEMENTNRSQVKPQFETCNGNDWSQSAHGNIKQQFINNQQTESVNNIHLRKIALNIPSSQTISSTTKTFSDNFNSTWVTDEFPTKTFNKPAQNHPACNENSNDGLIQRMNQLGASLCGDDPFNTSWIEIKDSPINGMPAWNAKPLLTSENK